MQMYVKVYFDFGEVTATLSDSEFRRLVLAEIEYAETGEAPDLKGAERHLFPLLKNQIDRDKSKYTKAVENGRLGGRPSKHPELEENLNKPNETEENLNKPNETKNKEERIKNKEKRIKNEEYISNAREKFERFWSVYPKKVGKEAAWKAFGKVKVPVETLISAVERQKRSKQWQRDNGQYIPNPATWLNQGRWDDEVVVEQNKGVIAQPSSDEIRRSFADTQKLLRDMRRE